jgi:cytochrome c peroxidase
MGYELFRGKAQCNKCHRDGGPGEDPLFTDFTASNIDTPANPRLPYYAEDRPSPRLRRKPGRIVIRRPRRRPFSHSKPSAQPALTSGCAMASPRA